MNMRQKQKTMTATSKNAVEGYFILLKISIYQSFMLICKECLMMGCIQKNQQGTRFF